MMARLIGENSMRALPAIAALASSLIFAPALAGSVPTISGKYATAYNEICQANNPSNPTPGVGETYSQTVIASFDSKAGTVKITGTSVTGPLIGNYVALSQSPISESGPYSNTATTLSIGGATFNIAYGPVKNGIAQTAVFGGISSGGCAATAVAIRQ
jgi:hypothetical protein